jgi:methyl-accepting chemotaxis protein
MNQWTVRKRIVTGFASILTVFAVVAVAAFFLLQEVKHKVGLIRTDSLVGLRLAGEIRAHTGEIQLDVMRHLLAKSPAEKKMWEENLERLRSENDAAMAQYEKAINQPSDREMFTQLADARTKYVAERAMVLDLSRAGKAEEAYQVVGSTLRPLYQAYQAKSEELVAHCQAEGEAFAAECHLAASHASNIIVASAVFAIVLGNMIGFLIVRSLTKALSQLASSLNDGSQQVTAAATELSSTSQSLAEGASEQAASLEETSASLEEIAAMTKRNAENANDGKKLGTQTRESAEAGLESLAEMGRTLGEIKSAVGEMQSAVGEMQGSSQEIAKIIKTIDEIAFQTNLLALNAAVEAARAGEAGAGFAVVADEVRALAQRSAQAARDTSEKIESAVKRSQLGGVASTKVVKSLGEVEATAQKIQTVFGGIAAQIKSLDGVIAEIANASQEQTAGIMEVNAAVTQLDKVTQANAAGAEENAASSEELNSQAITLQDIVQQLQMIVSGPPSVSQTSESNAGGRRKKTSAAVLGVENHPAPKAAPARTHTKQEIPMPEKSRSGATGSFKDF